MLVDAPSHRSEFAHAMDVPGLSTATKLLRNASEIHPGRPALWLGLRVAAATAVPIALEPSLGPIAGTWAPLAGYGIAQLDKGGAYATRARGMLLATVGTLLAIALGSALSGAPPLLKVLLLTVLMGGIALTPAWGSVGTSVGLTIGVQLLVSTSIVAKPGDTEQRLVGYAVGAVWAMFLGLVVWPVRVYKPGRRAVASLLDAMAAHAKLLEAPRVDPVAWRQALTDAQSVLRSRIEAARDTLADTRRGRRSETGRGERLLAVVQTCEQMVGSQQAIEELLDTELPPATARIVRRGVENYQKALEELAQRVMIESRLDRVVTPSWDPAVAQSGIEDLHGAARAVSDHALKLVGRLQEDRMRVSDHIDSLYSDDQPLRVRLVEPTRELGLLEPLWSVLSHDSSVLRHALRVAAVVLAASTIATASGMHYGYWITMTAFLLMNPYRIRTTTRAVQRTVGTILGTMFAAMVANYAPSPTVLYFTIVLFAGLSASVLQLNYALYSMLVTPTFALLVDLHQEDPALHGVRILNTLLGGTLAFIASYLLWPVREQVRFGDALADALERVDAYVGEIAAAIGRHEEPPVDSVVLARRQLELALSNADQVLDRVFAEQLPKALVEPRMTLVAFTRRLASAINVFGTTRTVIPYDPHVEQIMAFVDSVRLRLRRLARAVRAGVPPDLPPRADVSIPDVVISARCERIEYQLSVLAEAARRAAPHESERRRDEAARRRRAGEGVPEPTPAAAAAPSPTGEPN